MEVRSSRENGSFLLVLALNSQAVLFSAYCREMGHTLSEKDGWFKPITLCSSIALQITKLYIVTRSFVFSLSTAFRSIFRSRSHIPQSWWKDVSVEVYPAKHLITLKGARWPGPRPQTPRWTRIPCISGVPTWKASWADPKPPSRRFSKAHLRLLISPTPNVNHAPSSATPSWF